MVIGGWWGTKSQLGQLEDLLIRWRVSVMFFGESLLETKNQMKDSVEKSNERFCGKINWKILWKNQMEDSVEKSNGRFCGKIKWKILWKNQLEDSGKICRGNSLSGFCLCFSSFSYHCHPIMLQMKNYLGSPSWQVK